MSITNIVITKASSDPTVNLSLLFFCLQNTLCYLVAHLSIAALIFGVYSSSYCGFTFSDLCINKNLSIDQSIKDSDHHAYIFFLKHAQL